MALVAAVPASSVKAAGPVHVAYIDAIRGIAFLGVLSLHAAQLVGNFPLQPIFLQGGSGV